MCGLILFLAFIAALWFLIGLDEKSYNTDF